MCRQSNIFRMKYKSYIPIEFKILVALRILGRDAKADDIAEITEIGESTVLSIFKTFIAEFSNTFLATYVHMPTGDDLLKTMECYRILGMPGAVGSVDCTHVRLARCPDPLHWLCKGKESYPSLSFLVVTDHFRRVLYVGNGCYGASSDKTISRNDKLISDFKNGKYGLVEYVLYDENGIPTLCKGLYLISDNGFPEEFSFFVPPNKDAITRNEVLWSEWLESIRKDVECFFGVLKARFRFLKNAIEYSMDTIDAAFKTACILHNMLLAYDGFDGSECSREDYWNALDPDLNDFDAMQNEEIIPNQDFLQDAPATFGNVIDMFNLRRYRSVLNIGIRINDLSPSSFKIFLQHHFVHQYRISDLWWPKGFSRKQRQLFDIPPMTKRVQHELAKTLYVKPSDYCGSYGEDIGLGLFSTIAFGAGQNIAYFTGDIINETEKNERVQNNQGGYIILIGSGKYLDCFRYKNKCKPSMANDCRGLKHRISGARGIANCKVVIDSRRNTARLETTKNIPANTEMLWNYGDDYGIVVI
jgi:hypothetical protein